MVFNIFAGTQHHKNKNDNKKIEEEEEEEDDFASMSSLFHQQGFDVGTLKKDSIATLHFLHFNIYIYIHILYECKQKNNSTKTKGNRNVSEHLEIML